MKYINERLEKVELEQRTLSRLHKLDEIGFMCSESSEYIICFITCSINVRYGPVNMTPKIVNIFFDGILEFAWCINVILEPSNYVGIVWFNIKWSGGCPLGSSRNKEVLPDGHDLGKNGRIRCNLLVEMKDTVVIVFPENAPNIILVIINWVGSVDIDFYRARRRRYPQHVSLVGRGGSGMETLKWIMKMSNTEGMILLQIFFDQQTKLYMNSLRQVVELNSSWRKVTLLRQVQIDHTRA